MVAIIPRENNIITRPITAYKIICLALVIFSGFPPAVMKISAAQIIISGTTAKAIFDKNIKTLSNIFIIFGSIGGGKTTSALTKIGASKTEIGNNKIFWISGFGIKIELIFKSLLGRTHYHILNCSDNAPSQEYHHKANNGV